MSHKQFVGKLAYLSNMYPVRIRINIQSIPYEFSCLESAFQALKSTNPEVHKAMESLNGYDAKAMSKHITVRSDWNEKKLQFMDKLLFVKFENAVLKEKLINEPVENIVEHNTWGDTFYGKYNGVGLDHLGRLLREHKQRLMNK